MEYIPLHERHKYPNFFRPNATPFRDSGINFHIATWIGEDNRFNQHWYWSVYRSAFPHGFLWIEKELVYVGDGEYESEQEAIEAAEQWFYIDSRREQ